MSGSRDAERGIFRRNTFLTTESFNGVASYTVGGDVYTSSMLRQIERVTPVGFTRQGLRVAVNTGSVSGNRFTAQVFRNTGVDTVGRFTGEIAAATDLSTDSFTVLLEGT